MKAPHVLRVSEPAEAFADLFAAARAEGVRAGWLEAEEMARAGEGALSGAAELARGVEAGALRTVRVETSPTEAGARVLTAKVLAGPPVFRDLLREHFLGCRLLLVRGETAVLPLDLPRLEVASPAPEGTARWRLSGLPGAAGEAALTPTRTLELSTDELLARLRRPRLG